ncbi:MAG: transcriptional regulator, TetR family [Microbacteriaceae bacterium]|nr:transcriptional regulator, TetR family [Microbacteriaceae bacterium]
MAADVKTVTSGRGERMDGIKRRSQIREVAAGLFDTRGYRETSMEAIAAAIGIKKASLYYYFRGKDELLVEMHEEMIDLILAQQQARLDKGVLSWKDQLLGIMTDLISLQETHPGYLRVFFEHFRELPRGVQGPIQAKRDRYGEFVVEVIRNGIAAGEFRDTDAGITALCILGSCNWTYQWLRPAGRLNASEVAKAFWSIYLGGIEESA